MLLYLEQKDSKENQWLKVPVATAIKSPEHLLRKIEEKLGAMKK